MNLIFSETPPRFSYKRIDESRTFYLINEETKEKVANSDELVKSGAIDSPDNKNQLLKYAIDQGYISSENELSVQIDEGWKSALTGAALSLLTAFTSSATAQNGGGGAKPRDVVTKNANGSQTRTVRTDSASVKLFEKDGYKLDAVELDTIFNEIKVKAPETKVQAIRLKFDNAKFFESGKFELDSSYADQIRETLDSIVGSKGLLMKVDITASTDKQRVGANLAALLKKMGYAQDNAGLAKARSESVAAVIKEIGVSDTVINSIELVEQGEGEVSDKDRYVYVDFIYIVKDSEPGNNKTISKVNKTYVMSKTWDTPKGEDTPEEPERFKLRLPSIHISLGTIGGKRNRGSVKCPRM